MTDNAKTPASADSTETQKLSAAQEPTAPRETPQQQGTTSTPIAAPEGTAPEGTVPTAHTMPTPNTTPTVSAVPSAPHSQSPVLAPAQNPASKPRTSTIIWGLILIAFGALLLALTMGVQIDLQLFAIAGLGVAGAVLLVSAALSTKKNKQRR